MSANFKTENLKEGAQAMVLHENEATIQDLNEQEDHIHQDGKVKAFFKRHKRKFIVVGGAVAAFGTKLLIDFIEDGYKYNKLTKNYEGLWSANDHDEDGKICGFSLHEFNGEIVETFEYFSPEEVKTGAKNDSDDIGEEKGN